MRRAAPSQVIAAGTHVHREDRRHGREKRRIGELQRQRLRKIRLSGLIRLIRRLMTVFGPPSVGRPPSSRARGQRAAGARSPAISEMRA